MSTTGERVRRDPRQGRQAIAGSNGRVRILRGVRAPDVHLNGEMPRTSDKGHTTENKNPIPLRTIEQPAYLILVVPDAIDGRLSNHDRDLIGLARALADVGSGAVCVAIFAPSPDDLGLVGADRVVDFSNRAAPLESADARVAALKAIVERERPRHILFPESDWAGADLGRRFAAASGMAAVTSVLRAEPTTVTRQARGGSMDVSLPTAPVLIVKTGVGELVRGARHEARAMDTADVQVSTVIADRGLRPFDPETVSLEEAEFIVAAGNGVTDWTLFHELAAELGASEGGSRVVVDAGAMPRDRQIGATGSMVSARCYLALGISGAPQHLQGIAACEHVLAVNRDPNCDMMKRANQAIVGDVQVIMRALLEAARRRSEGSTA